MAILYLGNAIALIVGCRLAGMEDPVRYVSSFAFFTLAPHSSLTRLLPYVIS